MANRPAQLHRKTLPIRREAEAGAARPPRFLVLINPDASRALAALPALSAWFETNCNATVITTAGVNSTSRMLQRYGARADRIVIGGGDGTISAALKALLALNKPLAVLPLGTANDFARTLSVPDDPLDAAVLALEGVEHAIDVGLVNDIPFLNVASIGVASQVTEAQNKARKQRWRGLSYAISAREALRKAKPFFVRIEVDGAFYWKGMVHQASVGNGRFHGGGLAVAEDAAIDDGKLHLYLLRPGPAIDLIASLLTLRLGFLNAPPTLQRKVARTVTIECAKPRAIDVDGDIRTMTPGRFSLRRKALRVVIPRHLPPYQRGLVDFIPLNPD